MGKILLVNFNTEIMEDYIFEKFFTPEKFWNGLAVFRK